MSDFSTENRSPQENNENLEEQKALQPLILDLQKTGITPEISEQLALGANSALKKVSENKAVFTLKDWEKILSKDGFNDWIANPKWKSMRSLITRHIGLIALIPEQSEQSWALYAPQYLMKKEEEMIAFAKRQTDDHVIPSELLDRAFATKPTIAPEQKNAAIACCSGKNAVVVTEGTAGAGKSFTLDAIREVYENCPPRPGFPEDGIGYDILGAALSWTAAKVLESSANLKPGSARAIEGIVREMDKAKEKQQDFFKRRSLLVVDEAGLVGISHMHKMLMHAAESKFPVRVILTGDSLQLNPVMAGNALEAIVDECGSSRLDTIRRQKQDSHRKAVKHFCFGRAHNALWTYWQQEAIHFCPDPEYRRELVMRDYVRFMVANPTDTALVLALDNKEVKTLNEQIRERLKQIGRLMGTEHSLTVVDGPGKSPFKAKFCVGDQVVLRKNNAKHPVLKSNFKKLHEGAQTAHEKGAKQANEKGFFSNLMNSWRAEKKENQEDEVIRLGVFNRMNAIILDIKKHPKESGEFILRLLLAEGGETEIDTSTYKDEESKAIPLTHNFATTIYASQGQTVQRVFMMDSPLMNRKLAYVGMSRHTLLCDIYLNLHELHERMALEQERLKNSSIPFAKDLIRKKSITDTKELDKLHKQVEQWAKEQYFKPSDYLRAVATVWNKDSLNPTAWIAKKRMKEKKEQVVKLGFNAFKPQHCVDDDPEDFPSERFVEPPAFDALQKINQLQTEAPKNKGFNFWWKKDAQQERSGAPMTQEEIQLLSKAGLENSTAPNWANSEYLSKTFNSLKGSLWNTNRYGYIRLFSKNPITGSITSRWRLDGQLMAGDGEPPVFLNEQHPEQAGWLIVPGAREAFASYQFFRKKHWAHPEKIPHIIVGFPTADFKALSKYLKPGTAPIYCAWSEKDANSLEKAQNLAKRLHALGHRVALYPKFQPPSTSSAPKL